MKLFRCKKGEKEVNNQRSNKLSKQPTGRKYSIYFWAAVSFCLIFYGTSSTSIEHFDENSLKNILNSIGQAIISGLVITFIINIPDMFSYFQKVLYKTITSDEYLEQLTLEEVEDLKNSCTKLISKSIPDIAEGLLELEYKIVEYYRSPYYENYSTFVSCSRNGNYLVKDITTEYTLKNPMAGKEKIEANIVLKLCEYKGYSAIYAVIDYGFENSDVWEQTSEAWLNIKNSQTPEALPEATLGVTVTGKELPDPILTVCSFYPNIFDLQYQKGISFAEEKFSFK